MWKTLDLKVNEYTISDGYSTMKLVRHPITWLFDRYTDQLAISRLLEKTEVDFWCILMLEIINTRGGYNVK